MERPNSDDHSALPPDPPPGSDPDPTPRYPKSPEENDDARRVTPLDDDKHIEEGIEINET